MFVGGAYRVCWGACRVSTECHNATLTTLHARTTHPHHPHLARMQGHWETFPSPPPPCPHAGPLGNLSLAAQDPLAASAAAASSFHNPFLSPPRGHHGGAPTPINDNPFISPTAPGTITPSLPVITPPVPSSLSTSAGAHNPFLSPPRAPCPPASQPQQCPSAFADIAAASNNPFLITTASASAPGSAPGLAPLAVTPHGQAVADNPFLAGILPGDGGCASTAAAPVAAAPSSASSSAAANAHANPFVSVDAPPPVPAIAAVPAAKEWTWAASANQ